MQKKQLIPLTPEVPKSKIILHIQTMPKTHFESELEELLVYPEHCFGEHASERWLYLCSALSKYQAPSGNYAIGKNRKWEVASAFQKPIRLSDKETFLRLIYRMANF